MIRLDQIRTDGGTQPRAELNTATVEDYAGAIREGATFPAVTVFYDGAEHWLADGFHRVAAHKAAGKRTIKAEVRQGSRRDAVLWSVGANAEHGLRRSNEDKRRAVRTLLEDVEWGKWSDREVARAAKVSHDFVNRLRKSLSSNDSETPAARTYKTKHGTVSTMRTENIGRRPDSDPDPWLDDDTEDEPLDPAIYPWLNVDDGSPIITEEELVRQRFEALVRAEEEAEEREEHPFRAPVRSPRRELDAYYTPPELAEHLVALLPVRAQDIVLEPHAGGGAFVRALKAKARKVIACDINPEAKGLEEADEPIVSDFLDLELDIGPEWVVGNPPYGEAEAHVRGALETTGRHVAFLLRLAFLESAERVPFWAQFPCRKVFVLAERPSFTGGGTDSCAYGFFWWDLEWSGPTELEVVSWK